MLVIENGLVVAEVEPTDRAAALAETAAWIANIEQRIASHEADPDHRLSRLLDRLQRRFAVLSQPDPRVLVDAPGEIGQDVAAVLTLAINAEAERRILADFPYHDQLNTLAAADPDAIAAMRSTIDAQVAIAQSLKERVAAGEILDPKAEWQ